MALNVADAGSTTQTMKTTTGSGEHVPHHIVDSGAIAVTGPVTISGQVIAVATGVQTISGTVFVSGVAITNVSGPVTISGGGGFITVTGSVVALPTGVQTISGTVFVSGVAITNISGPVTISGGGGFITVSGTVFASPSGVQTISGTVFASPSGVYVISGGEVLTCGVMRISGVVSTSGQVSITSAGVVGTASAGSLASIGGYFPVIVGGDDGANIRSLFINSAGGIAVTVSGVVSVSGSQVSVVQVSGPVTVTGGEVSVCGVVRISGIVSTSGQVTLTSAGVMGTVTAGSLASLGGGYYPVIVGGDDGANSRTLFVNSAGGIAATISGPVTISGTVVAVQSGVYTISGTVNAVATGIQTISGTVFVSGVAITSVSGPVTVSGTIAAQISGPVTVSGGGGFITVTGNVLVSGVHPVTVSGSVLISGGGGFITATGNVLVSGTVIAIGNVAHDAADSGAPVKIGAKALVTHSFAAVVSGDRTDAISDKYGAIIFAAWPIDLTQTTGRLITVTGETVIVAATASEFHDIVYMDMTHNASSGVQINVRDVTTSGHTRRYFLAAGGGIVMTPGILPLPQTTATAWTAEITTSDVQYSVNIVYRKRL